MTNDTALSARAAGTGRVGALRVLRLFFRIAAPTFVLVTFSISFDDSGTVWIMWRDAPLLALTLFALGSAFALAWGWVSRKIRLLTAPPDQSFSAPEPSSKAQRYNIWRDADPRLRLRLALAVFFIFSAFGPMTSLSSSHLSLISPLAVAITTIASGAIAASVILLGKRPPALAIAVIAFSLLSFYGRDIATLVAPAPATTKVDRSGIVSLSTRELNDLTDERTVVAGLGILCIVVGYVFFIRVLSVEGGQRVRLQAEMTIAQRIQRMLLPAADMRLGEYDVAGITIPAAEVGGDYHDYVALDAGAMLALVVADVSGHGVGAGILSAMTKSAFRSQVALDPTPSSLLSALNRTLSSVVAKGTFVSMVYFLLDVGSHRAAFATAGHPPAVFIHGSDGSAEYLRTPSLALGLSADARFEQVETTFKPGDCAVLFTDGVTEAQRRGGAMWGLEAFARAVQGIRAMSSTEIARGVVQAVTNFVAGANLRDDVTVVVVKRRNPESGLQDACPAA
jgi:serine phosphatase RsbU (regulator of sigma subunit)